MPVGHHRRIDAPLVRCVHDVITPVAVKTMSTVGANGFGAGRAGQK